MKLTTSAAACMAVFLAACGGSDGGFERCRNAATELAASGGGLAQEVRVACHFDVQRLERTCTGLAPDLSIGSSQTVRYASLQDFVEEATLVGRVRATSVAAVELPISAGIPPYLHALPGGDTSYEYDARGRITNMHFTAFDAQARPLAKAPTGICTNDTGDTWTYDEAARTATRAFNTRTLTPGPVPGVIPCIHAFHTYQFDPDGNLVLFGSPTSGISYTVLQKERICAPI